MYLDCEELLRSAMAGRLRIREPSLLAVAAAVSAQVYVLDLM